MRVLFDNGTPRGVAAALSEHIVEEARAHGWDALSNGALLNAAEAAGFDVLVTTDRNLRHQRNLSRRTLAVVVLKGALETDTTQARSDKRRGFSCESRRRD